jgi:hypothetical protein
VHTPESATPTATPTEPSGDISIDLDLNQDRYTAGDNFLLRCICVNPGPDISVEEYIVLDVYGLYFFWPGWTASPDFRGYVLTTGSGQYEEILKFEWPEGHFGETAGLYFYAALLDAASHSLLGTYDAVEFGYH